MLNQLIWKTSVTTVATLLCTVCEAIYLLPVISYLVYWTFPCYLYVLYLYSLHLRCCTFHAATEVSILYYCQCSYIFTYIYLVNLCFTSATPWFIVYCQIPCSKRGKWMKFDILLYGNNILTVQCLLQCVLHVKKSWIAVLPTSKEFLQMQNILECTLNLYTCWVIVSHAWEKNMK